MLQPQIHSSGQTTNFLLDLSEDEVEYENSGTNVFLLV